MKKVKTSYDQAVQAYTEFFGKSPTVNEINDTYHKYALDWKHFENYTDWLMYNTDEN